MMPTPDGFHEFEHDGWQRVPEAYDDSFGLLTSGAAGPLLNAARVEAGTRVLDVATGPGYVAAAAVQRGAVAVGVDFSSGMVERAKHRYPGVDYIEGNAEELEFDDGSFDAVVMNFGLLHLGRPDAALAEAYRVLRTGGHFAFTVWCVPDQAVGFGTVMRAVEAHGTLDVALPAGPPFFRFSDPTEAVRALADAGFTAPQTTTVPLVWRLPSPDALFDRMSGATVRTSGLLRAQSASALAAISAAMAAEAATWDRGGAIEIPMPALLASALK
jgi:ubiquinone/menaquinone biosynthesis C-methylase UbiE